MPTSSPPARPASGHSKSGFISTAPGDDNFFRPDAPDVERSALLPPVPARQIAHQEEAWRGWRDWQLALACLPDRDTRNGEYFKLDDIAPALGDFTAKTLYLHVSNLYPFWCGRYRFNLAHVLRIVKRYQLDGKFNYSRSELIQRARARLAES